MYGNYNNYGYNPYNPNANMQNRLTQMEQTYQQYNRPQQNPMSALCGRIVTGVEEAKASQIPLDGTVSYFPSPAENKIYAKGIDMNGLPTFLTYELKMQNQNNINTEFAENPQIDDLKCRILALENKFKEMEKNEPNAITSNAQ